MPEESLTGFIGIILYMMAWVLYLFLSTSFTILIIFLHYLGYYLFGKEEKRIEWLFFFLIFSILLDIFLYNPIHSLNLSILYLIAVNMIHILFFQFGRLKEVGLLVAGLSMVAVWHLFFPEIVQILTIIYIAAVLILTELSKKGIIILSKS